MSEKKLRTRAGTSVHRIELADGQLPDMACGVNGVAYQKWFRPTHIDVEFDPAGVVETRIYGRQIKQDGSLGLGILYHRWRRT